MLLPGFLPSKGKDDRVNGLLVRVGIDQASGGRNAPVDERTNEFVYVPIPENRYGLRRNLARRYEEVLTPFRRSISGTLNCGGKSMELCP